MAKGNLKKTAAANAAARRNLVLGSAITQAWHLAFLLLLWSAPWTRTQKVYYFLSTALEGFLVYTLLAMSAPRRDAAGNIVSAGEDLGQSGLTSYMFDILYITWTTHVLTALISSRFWWLYSTIPAYAFYKVYTMFIHPRLFSGRSHAPASEQPQEQLSRTQAKKQARGAQNQQVKYVRR